MFLSNFPLFLFFGIFFYRMKDIGFWREKKFTKREKKIMFIVQLVIQDKKRKKKSILCLVDRTDTIVSACENGNIFSLHKIYFNFRASILEH